MRPHSAERHVGSRVGWLRAAVLGANDGVVSTASLIVGVAAGGADKSTILLAGLAGLVAGAMSMAAGEYVSVSSQADAEKADLQREARELREVPEFERAELARIYEQRGLTPDLAREVADQLMAKDALAAHARDELGISDYSRARPLQAAFSSAWSFTAGAALALIAAMAFRVDQMTFAVGAASLLSLALLGGLAATVGGASVRTAVLRVVVWGALAMAVTALAGRLFGAVG